MAGIGDKEARALIVKGQKKGTRCTQADGTMPGLTLVATPAGTGSWRLRYYVGGRQKEATIGQYPTWGIREAREKARELRRAVDEGVDVAVEKQRRKAEAAAALTVDGLASAYFEQAERELARHTFNQRRSIHARFVSPLIGRLPAGDVKPADVAGVVRKSLDGGRTLPNITLTHCSLIFSHAVANGIAEANPCRDLRLARIVGRQEAPKQRAALTADELAAFLRALDGIPRPYALAMRLLLLTGVRVGTLAEAKVEEFDVDAGVWRVPHERRKNRRHTSGPFEIPLPPEAVAWVPELLTLADGNAYLLPVEARRHTDARNPLSKRGTLGDWLDRMRQANGGDWQRVTPHDLRSTCKSWLSALRVDYETRQRYLDHALVGMDAIYDKADYLDHRRAAAGLWLAFLNDCESGKEAAKVIPLPLAL